MHKQFSNSECMLFSAHWPPTQFIFNMVSFFYLLPHVRSIWYHSRFTELINILVESCLYNLCTKSIVVRYKWAHFIIFSQSIISLIYCCFYISLTILFFLCSLLGLVVSVSEGILHYRRESTQRWRRCRKKKGNTYW